MKKFAKWLVMILVVSCICALTLFATGCGEKNKTAKSVTISDNGEIVVTYDDDTTASLGKVGLVKSAEMKDGKFVLTLTDGKTVECPVAAAAKTVVSIKTVGNELEITYSTGDVEKISLGASVTCDHKNATYVEQVAHKLNADGKTFTNGIYLELCPDCGYAYTFVGVRHKDVNTVVKPTCTAEGYTVVECSVCHYIEGDKKDVVPALGHKKVNKPVLNMATDKNWCEKGGYTVVECDVCGETLSDPFYLDEKDAEGHKYKSMELITKPAYNASTGLLRGLCDVCGKADDIKMDPCKTGAGYELISISEGSCGSAKKATYKYTYEGFTFEIKDVDVPAGKHTLNGVEMDAEKDGVDGAFLFADDAAFKASGMKLFADETLSCGSKAHASYKCEACGEDVLVTVIKQHVRPANVPDDNKHAATCTEDGYWEYSCSACGNEHAKEIIPATGHNYEYTVTPKTSEDDNTTTYDIDGVCSVCKDHVEHLNLTDVVYTKVEATCTKAGNEHYEAIDEDGNTLSIDQPIAKLPHKLVKSDNTEVEMPEKDNNGTIYYDYTKFEGSVKLFADTEPSCKATFAAQFTCKDCGESVLRQFKVPHTAPAGTKVSDLTCTTDAVREDYTCTVCNLPQTGEVVTKAPGHAFAYEEAKEVDGKWVINGKCTAKNCDATDSITFDKKPTTTILEDATCTTKGKVRYIGLVNDERTIKEASLAMLPHETSAGEKFLTGARVPLGTKGVTVFADQPAGCGKEPANGKFVCKVCDQDVLVKVYAPHKQPATIPEANKKAATCTEYGYVEYTCTECNTPNCKDYTNPVGHTLTATVDSAKGTVTIKCTVEGCDMKPIVKQLPAPVKADTDATKINVGADKFYTELETRPATCGEVGSAKYSFKWTEKYDITKMVDDEEKTEIITWTSEVLEYVVTLPATGHKYVTVKDEKGNDVDAEYKVEVVRGDDTYIVTYKKCKECGKYIFVNEEKKDPATTEDTSDAA